jgi:CBS domain-containing protein
LYFTGFNEQAPERRGTMERARDLLKKKTKIVYFISPQATVFDALKLMGEKEVGALVVRDQNDNAVGIISERDYARKVVLRGKSSRDTLVNEIMTPADHVYSVTPDTTVRDCFTLMGEKHIRHVPVFENGKFMGMISIGDVVRCTLAENELYINQLHNFIAGR